MEAEPNEVRQAYWHHVGSKWCMQTHVGLSNIFQEHYACNTEGLHGNASDRRFYQLPAGGWLIIFNRCG
jgi:hypothetical protein